MEAHPQIDSTSSSSDSNSLKVFAGDADTEESDCATDSELGRADFWTCIKCKNQKDNPMYRFCGKCYQVKDNCVFTSSYIIKQFYSLLYVCLVY